MLNGIGEPQILSHLEIARLAFQVTGNTEKVTYIPAWLFKSGLTPLKWFSPTNYGPIEFLHNAFTHDMSAPSYGSIDLLSHFKRRYPHMKQYKNNLEK